MAASPRIEPVADAAPDVGRCATHLSADDIADLTNHGAEARQGAAVIGRKASKLASGRGVIVEDRQRLAFRQGQEIGLRPRHEAKTVGLQPQVADDFRGQQAHGVTRRGVAESRVEFLRHGGAADDGAAFQHAHAQARPGQVAGANQTVMATADDDDIGRGPGRHHRISSGRNIPVQRPIPSSAAATGRCPALPATRRPSARPRQRTVRYRGTHPATVSRARCRRRRASPAQRRRQQSS